MDPPNDFWPRKGLAGHLDEAAELRLLRQIHDVRKLGWPFWILGEWRRGEDGDRSAGDAPDAAKRFGMTPDFIFVIDGSSRIRHLQPLAGPREVLERILTDVLAE
jgi:hypothetical protein